MNKYAIKRKSVHLPALIICILKIFIIVKKTKKMYHQIISFHSLIINKLFEPGDFQQSQRGLIYLGLPSNLWTTSQL
jgi:hypothetical protein